MVLKVILSAFSIFIAGIIGLVRFRKINKIYWPLIFAIWLACINEVLSYSLFINNHSTAINNNIYVLQRPHYFYSLFGILVFSTTFNGCSKRSLPDLFFCGCGKILSGKNLAYQFLSLKS